MEQYPELRRNPATLFAFIDGVPERNREYREAGILPWWADDDVRLAFFRPLTGLTHWVDHTFWPESAVLMHAQSLVWLGATVLAAGAFYRRVLPLPWMAGLATVLFALDDAHGLPVFWVANRNAVVAMLFGVLALIAHDAWRRDGWKVGAVLGPVAFASALLGNESGVSTAGYLLAYALFLDSRVRGRLKALGPYVVAGLVWMVFYKAGGYGASGSAVYVDPIDSPGRFVAAAAERIPLLLLGQWGLPPSNLTFALSERVARIHWWVAAAFCVALFVVIVPLLRRDRAARFWALGMVLSLVPACGTFPADRLLFFAGLGGMALLVQLVAAVFSRQGGWLSSSAVRVACGLLLVIHLVIAPVNLAATGVTLEAFGAPMERLAKTLPDDESYAKQRVMVVNAPTQYICGIAALMRAYDGKPIARSGLVLGSGVGAVEVRRDSERTLVVRPEGGYLAPSGTVSTTGGALAAFDVGYILAIFDRLFRDDENRFEVGERVELSYVTIEVTELSEAGGPAAAAFRFKMDLDDESLRWLKVTPEGYATFTLPRVGETVTIPPVPHGGM